MKHFNNKHPNNVADLTFIIHDLILEWVEIENEYNFQNRIICYILGIFITYFPS